jgi:site-specific recombinase XerD
MGNRKLPNDGSCYNGGNLRKALPPQCPIPNAADVRVFKSRKGGEDLDRRQINRIVEAAASPAGINKKVSPH